jgi:putative flippase GtrA
MVLSTPPFLRLVKFLALTVQEEREQRGHDRQGLRGKINRLEHRYARAFQAAKLATGSGIGFLDSEIVLALGTYLLYGKLSASPNAFYSLNFLFLNIAAFVIGVSVAFFVSDALILQNPLRRRTGIRKTLEKLGKFQLIFLVGNLMMITAEILLLKELALPPVLGMIIGALVSFPISYYFSMHFVWQVSRDEPQILGKFSNLGRMPLLSLGGVESILPHHIETPYGNYYLDVDKYHLGVYPIKDGSEKLEFTLKVNLEQEK